MTNVTYHHYYCSFPFQWPIQQHRNLLTTVCASWSKLAEQNNLIVNDNEIMVYLLIWLRQSLSGELGMHRLLCSKRLLASIIIWPRWKALAHPYAGVSMVTVSQRRGFGFLFSADVLCLCLLLLLIVLHYLVYVSMRWCESFRDKDRQKK